MPFISDKAVNQRPLVSFIKTNGYKNLKPVIDRHFELLDIEKKLTKDTRVLLKPNLLMKRKPDEFTTTHPLLVEAVIVKLRELGIETIVVADSPGGEFTVSHLNSIYKATGMEEIVSRHGAELNFDTGYGTMENPNGVTVKKFDIINAVRQADFIINLPKLKTHGMTLLSGAVKNMFGSIPGLMKPEMHMRFPEYEKFGSMLVDLCETVKPNITIIDAVVSMEGDGPSAGNPANTNFTAAACCPYSLDIVLAELIGINPDDVSMLRSAKERKLCGNFKDIDLTGDVPEYHKDFKKPSTMHTLDFSSQVPIPGFMAKRLLGGFKPRPVIRKKDCIGCGKCAESCPAKIIKIENKKAQINYTECITCFCCHEMCPVKAVDIKKSRISSFLIGFGMKIFSKH